MRERSRWPNGSDFPDTGVTAAGGHWCARCFERLGRNGTTFVRRAVEGAAMNSNSRRVVNRWYELADHCVGGFPGRGPPRESPKCEEMCVAEEKEGGGVRCREVDVMRDPHGFARR